MNRRLALALAALLCLSGCDGKKFQQDPLQAYADPIRNGVPPEQKPEEEKRPLALPSDALKIDCADSFSFIEGQEGIEKISSRVLLPSVTTEITIERLDETLPGAVFDATTGELTWTPLSDTVRSGYQDMRRLKILLTASNGSETYSNIKTVSVFVTRKSEAPEIVDVSDLTRDPILEGATRDFTVRVKDPDGEDTVSVPPRLHIVSARRADQNAAHLVSIAEPGWNQTNPAQLTTGEWEFKMKLDARNVEMTSGLDTFQFQLIASSRFGNISAPRNVDVRLQTNVTRPVWTWNNQVEMIGGQENILRFHIYDPKREGKLNVVVPRCDRFPGGVGVCDCRNIDDSLIACEISWKPPSAENGTFTHQVTFRAINYSPVPSQKPPVSVDLTQTIRVIKDPNAPPPLSATSNQKAAGSGGLQ